MIEATGIEIRHAEKQDVVIILEFIKQLAEFERLSHEVETTEEALETYLFGERRYAEVLLAEAGGKPVGFALYFFNFSTFVAKPGLYLEDLFVDPAWRGKGVGRVLLQRLAQVALERDCGRMEWTVLDWNEPAIRFYRMLGARLMDEWTTCRLTRESIKRLADEGVG